MVSIEELIPSLTPEPGEARVFALDPVSLVGGLMRGLVCEHGRARCDLIRDPASREAALTGAGLLTAAGCGLTGRCHGDISFQRDMLGRPWIAGLDRAEVDLNMSRRPGCVAVIVARGGRCGVDIEQILSGTQHNQILDALRHQGVLMSGSVSRETVYRSWCACEAVLKADGRGLRDGLGVLEHVDSAIGRERWRCGSETWDVCAIPVPAGYVGAVALGDGLRLRRVSLCSEGISVSGSV